MNRMVVKRATLWPAGLGSEFGHDGLLSRPLAQAAPASKSRSAVAVGLIHESRLGPLAGHFARRVSVIHGQPRAHVDDSNVRVEAQRSRPSNLGVRVQNLVLAF